jgi:hypothetical protein
MVLRVMLAIVVACLAGDGLQDSGGGHTIAGRVLDAQGRVPQGVALFLYTRDGGEGSYSQAPVPLAKDGSFTTRRMPRGTYVLDVGPDPRGSMDADVDGGLAVVDLDTTDVTGVAITTRRSALRGRYVMRSDNPAAKWPSHIHVLATLVEGADAPEVSVMSQGAPNGEFVLRNAFGRRILRTGYTLASGERWWPESVLLDGVDVTNIPTDFSAKPNAKLEVTFTQHPARIAGRVTTATGQPAPGAWVVVFGADPTLWRRWASTTEVVQTVSGGRFSSTTTPGRYVVVALPATPYQVRPILPDFATLAARATAVTVRDREHVDVQLELPVPGPL